MSKELYEEALADAKQLIEVAETNAKKAILDQVAPRIRELIEQHILSEHSDRDEDDDDELLLGDVGANKDEEPLTTLVSSFGDKYPTSPPASQATDLEQGVGEEDVQDNVYQLSLESVDSLDAKVVTSDAVASRSLVEQVIDRLGKQVLRCARSIKEGDDICGTHEKIVETIQLVENMYEYVHEGLDSSGAKDMLENKLETSYKDLNKLREHTMSKIRMNEEDLKLVLKGLPELDDESLQGVSVDLVLPDEDELSAEEPMAEPTDEEPALEEPAPEPEADLGALPGEDAEEPVEDEDEVKEDISMSMSEMDDDTVIEIDEAMLRREIKKMRALREAKSCEPKIADDFGGGKVDHEAFLDGEVTTEAEDSHEDEEELKETEHGDEDEVVSDAATCESLKRRIAVEKRSIHATKEKMTAIKERAISSKSAAQRAALKEAWANASERLALSEQKVKKMEAKLQAEAKQQTEGSNSDSDQLAELKAELKSLRDKLAEQNLVNTKLLYTNKLLQAEGLTSKQKASIIESLDSAQSLREVKLLYVNLAKANDRKARVSESTERKVIGSASRVAKPASVQPASLNEAACEAERWARLAGITK